jgi:hypothetical protein
MEGFYKMSLQDESENLSTRSDLEYVNQSIHERIGRVEMLLYVCIFLLSALASKVIFGLEPFWK